MIRLKHEGDTLAITATFDDWRAILHRMEEPFARTFEEMPITVHFATGEEEEGAKAAVTAAWKDGAVKIAVP